MKRGKVDLILKCAKGIRDTGMVGTQDPYAILQYGQEKVKTPTDKNAGTHPKWNYRWTFDVNEYSPSAFKVDIYNDNLMFDDHIGSADVELSEVCEKGVVENACFPVRSKDGRVRGDVEFTLTFVADQGQAPGQAFPQPAAYAPPQPQQQPAYQPAYQPHGGAPQQQPPAYAPPQPDGGRQRSASATTALAAVHWAQAAPQNQMFQGQPPPAYTPSPAAPAAPPAFAHQPSFAAPSGAPPPYGMQPPPQPAYPPQSAYPPGPPGVPGWPTPPPPQYPPQQPQYPPQQQHQAPYPAQQFPHGVPAGYPVSSGYPQVPGYPPIPAAGAPTAYAQPGAYPQIGPAGYGAPPGGYYPAR